MTINEVKDVIFQMCVCKLYSINVVFLPKKAPSLSATYKQLHSPLNTMTCLIFCLHPHVCVVQEKKKGSSERPGLYSN